MQTLQAYSVQVAARGLQGDRLTRPRMGIGTIGLLVFSSFITTITIAVLFSTLKIPLPTVFEQDPPELSWDRSEEFGKDKFLEVIRKVNERELASKAHFITNVMKTTRRRVINPKDLSISIINACRELNYDPIFVTAIMNSESAFKRSARSPVGARGLMQIMPATGKHIADTEGFEWKGTNSLITDQDYNIKMSIAYLKQLEGMFQGDLRKVLIAYNWGPANMRKALRGKARIPKVSLNYTRTILSDYKKWRDKFQNKKSQYKYMNASYLHS